MDGSKNFSAIAILAIYVSVITVGPFAPGWARADLASPALQNSSVDGASSGSGSGSNTGAALQGDAYCKAECKNTATGADIDKSGKTQKQEHCLTYEQSGKGRGFDYVVLGMEGAALGVCLTACMMKVVPGGLAQMCTILGMAASAAELIRSMTMKNGGAGKVIGMIGGGLGIASGLGVFGGGLMHGGGSSRTPSSEPTDSKPNSENYPGSSVTPVKGASSDVGWNIDFDALLALEVEQKLDPSWVPASSLKAHVLVRGAVMTGMFEALLGAMGVLASAQAGASCDGATAAAENASQAENQKHIDAVSLNREMERQGCFNDSAPLTCNSLQARLSALEQERIELGSKAQQARSGAAQICEQEKNAKPTSGNNNSSQSGKSNIDPTQLGGLVLNNKDKIPGLGKKAADISKSGDAAKTGTNADAANAAKAKKQKQEACMASVFLGISIAGRIMSMKNADKSKKNSCDAIRELASDSKAFAFTKDMLPSLSGYTSKAAYQDAAARSAMEHYLQQKCGSDAKCRATEASNADKAGQDARVLAGQRWDESKGTPSPNPSPSSAPIFTQGDSVLKRLWSEIKLSLLPQATASAPSESEVAIELRSQLAQASASGLAATASRMGVPQLGADAQILSELGIDREMARAATQSTMVDHLVSAVERGKGPGEILSAIASTVPGISGDMAQLFGKLGDEIERAQLQLNAAAGFGASTPATSFATTPVSAAPQSASLGAQQSLSERAPAAFLDPNDVWHKGSPESIFGIVSKRYDASRDRVNRSEWQSPMNRLSHGLSNTPGKR